MGSDMVVKPCNSALCPGGTNTLGDHCRILLPDTVGKSAGIRPLAAWAVPGEKCTGILRKYAVLMTACTQNIRNLPWSE